MAENISENPTLKEGPGPTPPSPDEIAPLFPQLEILEVLGHGGMGVVYKARQTGLDRLVALKILPPSVDPGRNFAERFAREARALASLQHPNIVTVHDSGQAGEYYYFVMEYVDGMNLRRAMDAGRLTPEQALGIVPLICDALQYAHDEGVMHRDIKPENILLDRRGRVKIADFGLVKLISGEKTDYTLTAPQQVMGTLHYMAPEQVENPSSVDHRADIYALGVVLYEILTGELPIGRFPLPSEKTPLDPRLDEIVLHALEKEPDKRYQNASDVKTDVQVVSGTYDRAAAAAATPAAVASIGPAAPAPAIAGGGPAIGGFALPPDATGMFRVRSTGIAYLLWLLGLVGLGGIHRMYAGKWITGVLWLLTGGLFLVGQIIDLVLIPGMIKMANLESAFLARTIVEAGRSTGHGHAHPTHART
jgi:TM2 domain-containing membrane protein YozV/predicted Ser/Thr protein kinase